MLVWLLPGEAVYEKLDGVVTQFGSAGGKMQIPYEEVCYW
jgi:putative transposon-encoded protein